MSINLQTNIIQAVSQYTRKNQYTEEGQYTRKGFLLFTNKTGEVGVRERSFCRCWDSLWALWNGVTYDRNKVTEAITEAFNSVDFSKSTIPPKKLTSFYKKLQTWQKKFDDGSLKKAKELNQLITRLGNRVITEKNPPDIPSTSPLPKQEPANTSNPLSVTSASSSQAKRPTPTTSTQQTAPATDTPNSLAEYIRTYNEKELETYDFPCVFKEALDRFHNPEIKRQGDMFPQFLYQRSRGGGNCFYLSYLSGWLHHLMQERLHTNPEAFAQSIATLKEKAAEAGLTVPESFLTTLENLHQNPTFDSLYEFLLSKESVQPVIQFLRDYAVDRVANGVDPVKKTIAWDDDTLFGFDIDGERIGGIFEGNKDVFNAINKIATDEDISMRDAYKKYQGSDGRDVQRPEIGALHENLCKVTIYQRFDNRGITPQIKQNKGLLTDYGKNNPIVLWSAPNHFDVLLRKELMS